jgi:branched-chain amino acid transport system substrate-binding protein
MSASRSRLPFLARAAIALVALAALAACGGEEEAATPAAEGPPKPSEYRVGLIAELTGPFSSVGEDGKKAVELYFTRVAPQIDGVPVRLITCDAQSTPEQAVACARKLIEQDRVHIILGPYVSVAINPVVPVAQAARIVHLHHSPLAEAPADSYTFATQYGGPEYDAIPALRFFRERGWTRVGVIATTDRSGQALLEQFERFASQFGITYRVERMEVTDTDVTTQLASLRSFNPQVIAVLMSGQPGAVVYRGMQLLGISMPTWFISSNATSRFMQATRDIQPRELYFATGLAVEPSYVEDPEARAQLESFSRLYEQVYGVRADVIARGSLNYSQVAAYLLRVTRGDSAKMKELLESGQPIPGVLTMSFTRTRHFACTENCRNLVVQLMPDQSIRVVATYTGR